MLEPGGFGGVKMTGEPLPHCQFSVERAYEGAGESYDCVNRRFFDCTDDGRRGPAGLRPARHLIGARIRVRFRHGFV